MADVNYEYKSVRIASSDGCLVMQKLLDISLNNEVKDGWKLFTLFPHHCPNQTDKGSCIVAIFQREARA